MAKASKPSATTLVNQFMQQLDHPLKPELERLRTIILEADPRIQERIKWNGPSFHFRDIDMSAFNLRAPAYLLMVVVFHGGKMIDDNLGFLEGAYKDRRSARFSSMAHIEATRPALEQLVRRWLDLHDVTPAA